MQTSSITLYEMSEHRFDITSGVLRRAWCVDGSDNVVTPRGSFEHWHVAADTCTRAGGLSTVAMLEGEGAEASLEAQEVCSCCRR